MPSLESLERRTPDSEGDHDSDADIGAAHLVLQPDIPDSDFAAAAFCR